MHQILEMGKRNKTDCMIPVFFISFSYVVKTFIHSQSFNLVCTTFSLLDKYVFILEICEKIRMWDGIICFWLLSYSTLSFHCFQLYA